MKSFGLLYVGTLKYWHKKFFPLVEMGTTQETEMPYRKGKCLVFRFPFTHPGFFIGLWVYRPEVSWDDDEKIDALLSEAMRSRAAWKPADGAFDDVF